MTKKYFWPCLIKDIEAYVKGYDMVSKVVKHKPYRDL